jgi:Cu+-exporting ATPase
VEGVLGDDRRHALVGSPAFLASRGVDVDVPAIGSLQAAGASVVAVALENRLAGVLALSDAIRSTSRTALARIAAEGVDIVMLSGDNAVTVEAIAGEAGIAKWRGNVSPEGKADEIRRLQAEGKVVGMVGDGINDAPALAAADVSFAMGAGSAIAIEAADVTIVRDDLGGVADAIRLSRATRRTIRQNLFLAFAYNTLGIPLAALGWLSPLIAGAAMAMSSVSVVGNALLLGKELRWKRPGSRSAA